MQGNTPRNPGDVPEFVARWFARRVAGHTFRDGRAFVRAMFSVAYHERGRVLTADESARLRVVARAAWSLGAALPNGYRSF